MARITLVTMGSWGDLFPFVGLARTLRDRGHAVQVAASPAWADVVGEADIEFVGIGKHLGFEELRRHPEIFKSGAIGLRHALDRFLFDQIDNITHDLGELLEGTDLVVVHPAHVAAHNLAEAMRRPRVVATVFPTMIPSSFTVPPGTPAGPWRGRLGRAANRLAWTSAEVVSGFMFDGRINRHRESLGLSRMRRGLLRLTLEADGVVVMAAPQVVDTPPDWPPHIEVTSFVTWDRASGRVLDPATEKFLADGEPPVLITLGTSSALQPHDFFEVAVSAVTTAGGRALVLTGPAPKPPIPASSNVHVEEYAPFSLAMPRCRAAIHHAGLGTTAEAIRAGIPQIVVPMGFDQPVTAARIEDLGVGLSVPWRARRRRLPRAVNTLFRDRCFQSRAEELAVAASNGAPASADAIERHLPAT